MTGVRLVHRCARASSSWRPGGTIWSRVVTTTAAETSTWLIQLADEKPQTARMAETAVARAVRLSWAMAHLPVTCGVPELCRWL